MQTQSHIERFYEALTQFAEERNLSVKRDVSHQSESIYCKLYKGNSYVKVRLSGHIQPIDDCRRRYTSASGAKFIANATGFCDEAAIRVDFYDMALDMDIVEQAWEMVAGIDNFGENYDVYETICFEGATRL